MSSYSLIFLLSFIVLLYEANASSGMGHCTTGYRTPSLYHQYCCLSANEAPWCVDSPADIHLSDNVLLVMPQKKKNQFCCNNSVLHP